MNAVDELSVITTLAQTDPDEALKRMALGLMRGNAADFKQGYSAANAARAAQDYLEDQVAPRAWRDADVIRALAPDPQADDFIAFLHYLEEQGATASTIIHVVEKPGRYWEQYADYLVSEMDGNSPSPTPLGG